MTPTDTRVRRSRRLHVLASTAAFAIAGACTGTSTAQPGAASASVPAASQAQAPAAPHAAVSGAAFCAKLQPLLQPFVKPALALFQASDRTNNDLQSSDASYVECDFRPPAAQVDISLHDDADQRFDDPNKQGFAVLAGFGEKARYTVHNGEMRWVDMVRGSVACEARFTIPDAQINGDWKLAAGTACDAAFSVR